MSLKSIRLELARSPDTPDGDPGHGYVFRAPLDAAGHLDEKGWRDVRDFCVVRRLERGDEVERGMLLRTRGGQWVFSYAPGTDDDEPIFRLSSHNFAPGAYVSITEHDGVQRTFRVASVDAWGAAPSHIETASSGRTAP
jgi:hypothetical protein